MSIETGQPRFCVPSITKYSVDWLTLVFLSLQFVLMTTLQLPLQYGSYDVGFEYRCIYDKKRFYQTSFPNKQTTLRPIPINTWYPAKNRQPVSKMSYQDYWNFYSPNSSLNVFHQRLKAYHIEKTRLYFSGKEDKDWTSNDETHFLQLLQSHTIATQNAPMIEEAFPMIVYHQGLDAHIDDNALMMEYLASWGYVVVNSSYHSTNAKTLALDWDLERSIADMEAIIQYKNKKNNVNAKQLILIGHSFGAQAMLGFVGKKYEAYQKSLKAVISLDSTIDYDFYQKNSRILEVLTAKKSQFQTPILAFARLSASFTLLNSLLFAQRYYCKIGHLLHNDFISIGAIAAWFRFKNLQNEDGIVWQNYQQICVLTRCFLDASVKKEPRSQMLFKKPNFEKISMEGLQCEQLQNGTTERTHLPYTIGDSKPPTFDQLINLIQTEGKSVVPLLQKQFPKASIFSDLSLEEVEEYVLKCLGTSGLNKFINE